MKHSQEDRNLRDFKQNEKDRLDLKGWANIRNILEAQQWVEWPSGDILIRVKRKALVGCENPGVIPLDACEVSEISAGEIGVKAIEAKKRSPL